VIVLILLPVTALFFLLRAESWEQIVVCATDVKVSKIPMSVYKFYGEHFLHVNSKTRGSTGLTPIQFAIGGFGVENSSNKNILNWVHKSPKIIKMKNSFVFAFSKVRSFSFRI